MDIFEIEKEAQAKGAEKGFEKDLDDSQKEKTYNDSPPKEKKVIYPPYIRNFEEKKIFYENFCQGYKEGYNIGYNQ